jgi:hypothetical protein
MDQATNQTTKTLRGLFSNPSELLGIITNPGINGVNYFKSLSGKDKQYLAFAAAAGFIMYGIFLNRKGD